MLNDAYDLLSDPKEKKAGVGYIYIYIFVFLKIRHSATSDFFRTAEMRVVKEPNHTPRRQLKQSLRVPSNLQLKRAYFETDGW